MRYRSMLILLLVSCASGAPLSIDELRSGDFSSTLHYEQPLAEGDSFTAYLVSYRVSGLKLRAMVALPKTAQPAGGFPVLIANHGYHPDPPRYGISASGADSRPGDYYRSVPALYTSRGFLVIMPDYRGHNVSDGLEFTRNAETASAYYAEDVLALVKAVSQIEEADASKLFMWSHSMGGAVSLRVLLATEIVQAASFWSTSKVDDLLPDLSSLEAPLIIHHATGDQSTEMQNSLSLADVLQGQEHCFVLHRYRGEAHFFEPEDRQTAADRDVAFFRQFLDPSETLRSGRNCPPVP